MWRFQTAYMHTTRAALSILHWRCNTISAGFGNAVNIIVLAFNTPLEMRIFMKVEDVVRVETFQYSIGDALITSARHSSTDGLSFQYSIGDAA